MFEEALHRKLLKSGEQGQGIVTARNYESTGRGGEAGPYFGIHGHIKFPDGSQTEFKAIGLNENKVGYIDVAAVVPVRYDAADHSKVILDVVAAEAQYAAAHDQATAGIANQNAGAIAQYDAAADPNSAADRPGVITSGTDGIIRIPPPQPPTPSGSPAPLVADELAKLADLRDRGVLTDEEFQAQKSKLLP